LFSLGLKNNYEMVKRPKMFYETYGKPFFVECRWINFSISHCSNGVCCGISDSEIGVNIQNMIEDFSGILNLTMSDEEIQKISKAEFLQLKLTRFWALKECYLKYHGICLNTPMNQINF
jgi:4'-phosphopantetheinyl transferase